MRGNIKVLKWSAPFISSLPPDKQYTGPSDKRHVRQKIDVAFFNFTYLQTARVRIAWPTAVYWTAEVSPTS
jgi:hypothetical protein